MSAAPAPAPPVTRDEEHANALAPGTMLAEYRIERVLGSGGFGTTYLAWDGNLEKHVAIKEYLPATLAVRALDGSLVPIATHRKHDYAWGLERFVKEARTLARFSHPHIVRVYRYFEANATAYMVMDYEAGASLSVWLRRQRLPSEQRLRAILLPLLDGLEAIHAKGFLHRDIKPSNILLREDGAPVLLDFGSARQAGGNQTRTLTSIVSPGYAPLEQYSSDGHQGPWTDIYSMSAVLYRAISGAHPPDATARVRSDPLPQLLRAHQGSFSAPLLDAIRWGLEVDERHRPRSVAEWRPVLTGERRHAQPAEAPTPRASAAALPPEEGMGSIRSAAAPRVSSRSKSVSQLPPAPASQPPALLRLVGITLTIAGIVGLGLQAAVGKAPATAATAPKSAISAPATPGSTVPVSVADRSVAITGAIKPAPIAQAQAMEPEDKPAEPAIAEGGSPARAEATPATSLKPDTMPPLEPRLKPRPSGPTAAGSASATAWTSSNSPLQLPPFLVRELEMADANRDGVLTVDEARGRVPLVERNFVRIDTDRDGRVSREEVLSFHQAARPRGPRP